MAYCTNCGNRLGAGAELCPKCGRPVTISAAPSSGNNMGNTRPPYLQSPGNTPGNTPPPYSRRGPCRFNIGDTDYTRLNNVTLITGPSQHAAIHYASQLLGSIVLAVDLIILASLYIQAEGASEIGIDPSLYPVVTVTFLILVSCGLMQRKIRYDIIHKLPKGFDRWKILYILKWQVFGFESLKVAALRLFMKSDLNYPELGFGTDADGNYYAFAVPGKDVYMYSPNQASPDHL